MMGMWPYGHYGPRQDVMHPCALLFSPRVRGQEHPALWSTEWLTRRKGMMLSLAMACNRRGAPVRLCRPAPQVEKKEPMTMTQGEGQASVPTTRFLLTPSPYLQGPGSDHIPCKEPPNPWM